MTVRQATRADLDLIVDILSEGFTDDPTFKWMFQGPGFERSLRAWMELACGVALSKGPAYLAGECSAVLFTALGVPLIDSRELELAAELFAREQGPRGERVLAEFSRVGEAKPAEPESVQLVYLATRPADRGRGMGARVVAPMLAECDRQGWPAFLNSSAVRSVPFYRRIGFEVLGEIEVPDGGPTIRPMWREPR